MLDATMVGVVMVGGSFFSIWWMARVGRPVVTMVWRRLVRVSFPKVPGGEEMVEITVGGSGVGTSSWCA